MTLKKIVDPLFALKLFGGADSGGGSSKENRCDPDLLTRSREKAGGRDRGEHGGMEQPMFK